MTQASRPAADHVTNYPTSDAGPYSADQWAELFNALFSSDVADQGPIVRYLNELSVSLNAAGPPPVFRVATGAAMANGHFFHSDANVDFTIPQPAANPRIDRVVVLVNNTNALVTVSDLGFTLDFPDSLVDYNGTASVEPYTARLVIVQGTEAAVPVAPGLDQSTAHYMIPLYQYEINVAGATSNATDQREFCRFGSGYGEQIPNMPALYCYNTTDAQAEPMITDGWGMPDAKFCNVYGVMTVPIDTEGTYTLQAMVRPAATGNLRWGCTVFRARCADNTHPGTTTAATTTAVTINTWECLDISSVACQAEDILTAVFYRDGANVLDTVGAAVNFKGFILTMDSNLL